MRRVLSVLPTALILFAAGAAAEDTRTLRVELSAAPGTPFVVENLVGTMTVAAADVPAVVATATVHAEDPDLADMVRFERVTGRHGAATLRVIYPVRHYTRYRYPGAGDSSFEYDHRTVRVSSRRGVRLWADVEVLVPLSAVEATFRNYVGKLSADGLQGTILLDAASADIVATSLTGDITADTGSGDVEARGIRGSFDCDTGSGDCMIADLNGEELRCDTGSGNVRVDGVIARLVLADTGSGSVRIDGADIDELRADTGSGDVELETVTGRLRRVRADTGSGDVTVYLPADASFLLRADVGNGDIISRFRDAEAITSGREIVGFRRGNEYTRIDADTGSGDVKVAPLR